MIAFELPLLRIEAHNRNLRAPIDAGRALRRRFALNRRVEKQRQTLAFATRAHVSPRSLPHLLGAPLLVITLTRLGPGTLDDDGLAAAFKASRDGIADGLKVADNHPQLRWRYSQERSATYGVRVALEPMSKVALAERLAAEELARP